jgi:hypothetical protein
MKNASSAIPAGSLSPAHCPSSTWAAQASKATYRLLALLSAIALMMSPAWAVDLTALTTIGGPLASALTQVDSLTPGIKALIGVIGFLVAFIALAAARNASPVLFYIMLLIFGAVGLPIGAAILGAVI